jgi:CDP-glycerol glycerophosphotransferase (TagB/SpsB family)
MEDKVIRFMSFKHMVYLYAAKLLIASESKGHCYDIRIQKGKLKRALDKKKIVFLQHGVIAFKKVEFFKKSKNKMDLFVVSSDYEKEIIKKYFEYNDREIINTGLCRWDVLEDRVDINNRQILIMPTWRAWMDGVSDQQFIDSDYYKNYFELLNSKELYKIIRRNNIKLNFFIHPKFKEYIGNFSVENENINIYQFGEIELNKLLMEASLLITDYSSVAWDMYYQKKPVIFYQFDIDDYDMYQGSYIDMETELYGDRVFQTEELINVVKEYIAREFKEKEQFADMRSIYLSHVDKNNCERTYNAIMERKDMIRMKKYDFFLLLKNNYYVRSTYSRLKRNKFLHIKMKRLIMRLKK